VPKIVLFLSADDYVRDESVSGIYGTVRLHRTVTGRVRVTYANVRIVEVLTSYFSETYLVDTAHGSGKSFTTHIMARS
jgi:hypothetical protein